MKKKKSPSPAKKKVPAKRKATIASSTIKNEALKNSKLILTKKIEAEILNVYNEAWEAYLKGDLKTHGFHLSNNFKIIGSSEAEQFNSKQSWLAYCKKTIKQFAGVIQLKNRKIKLVPAGEDVMVVENADIYVLIDKKWSFYSRIRITALLQKEKTGWKYIHQHGSLPDARASEGEVIATAQIKKENLLLKEAVKRRTIELETKNQELEIEASLERIRTVAMAMRKPEDMLQICKSLYTELETLGFSELRNSMINVYDDVNASFLNYDFSGEAGLSTTFFKNNSHPVIGNFIKQVRKTRDAFAPFSLSGKKLSDFIRFRELNGEKTDLKLRKAKAIHYYFYSIGNGSIGISTLETIPDQQIQTLKRFRNVFEIAYQRYTDISLAEAQAREAQIELALERVRARTMAMQKSEELAAVAEVLRKEMGTLGVEELETSSIYIVDDTSGTSECWYAIKDVRGKNKNLVTDHMTLRLDDTWVGRQMKKFHRSRETRVSVVMQGENRKEWINYCADQSSVLQGYYGGEIPERTYHLLKFSNGFMGAASPGEISTESWDLLQRATAVFSFAYKRFSDLQKAETQARESQIEAALERVRSASMAMRQTSELNDVSMVLYDQLRKLGFQFISCGFTIVIEEEQVHDVWNYDFNRLQLTHFQMPLQGDSTLKERYKAWKSKKTIFLQELNDTALEKHLWITSPEELKREKNLVSLFNFPHPAYFCFANFSKGYLHVIGNSQMQINHQNILPRFAKVFEQTYTRFLDLQKAEAQTREAEVELALERVRAKTMAMHRSDELREVVVVLYAQMTALGLAALGCELILCDEEAELLQYWSIAPGGAEQPDCYPVPRKSHPFFQQAWQAWKKRTPRLVVTLQGQEKRKFDKHIFEKTAFRNFPERAKKIIKAGKVDVFSLVTMKYGLLEAVDIIPLPEDKFAILERFAKVFEQTYTRFLDLQKAEAQTKEAKIEAALERVRSVSLGMHKSDDLEGVVVALFDRLNELGIPSYDAVFIIIFNRELRSFEMWVTGNVLSEPTKVKIPFDHSMAKNQIISDLWNVLETGEPIINRSYSGKEKNDYFRFIAQRNDFSDQLKKYHQEAESWTVSFIGEKNSIAGFDSWSGQKTSEENFQILKRFSKVFSQAHTRFLDLQKAEAQAREAQIEAALERVRSRSLAMHESDELNEVIAVLYEQMQLLRVGDWGCSLNIYNETENYFEIWLSTDAQRISPQSFRIEGQGHQLIKENWDIWKSQEQFRFIELKGAVKVDYDEYVMSQTGLKHLPDNIKKAIKSLPESYASIAAMKHGTLNSYTGQNPFSKTEFLVLQRFAKVFEQAYTRFLDLQKAEAQAREAQIEAALERVRSRTMGMQKSEDLREVVKVLYAQLSQLGFQWGVASITIMDPDTNDIDWWMEGFDDGYDLPEKYHVPYFDHKGHLEQLDHWKKGSAYAVIEISGSEKKTYDNYYFNHTDFVKAPENTKHLMMQQESVLFSMAYMQYGALSWSPSQISGEQAQILQRFAKVFEQTYTRFQDLQKAEAQAREAQVEVALERVRSRTMAMHKSDELNEVAFDFFNRLHPLGIAKWGFALWLADETNQKFDVWFSTPTDRVLPEPYSVPIKGHPVINKIWTAYENKSAHCNIELANEEKREWDLWLFENSGMKNLPDAVKDSILSHPYVQFSFTSMRYGLLDAIDVNRIPDEQLLILQRFAKVFEQTYTRFLDLQKAEAQAREAQIEAALERIRSSAMAMHSSDGILEVTQVLREQIAVLGEKELESIVVNIYHEDTDQFEAWYSYRHPENTEKQIRSGRVMHSWSLTARARADKEKYYEEVSDYTLVADYKMLKEWYEILLEVVPEAVEVDADGKPLVPDVLYYNYSKIAGGTLLLITNSEASDHSKYLLRRAAVVFNLAYSRFLDLQKAEAQAREAQVEAALERVRSRSMAMHQSDELNAVLSTMFTELTHLDFSLARCVIWIFDKLNKSFRWYSANPEAQIETYHVPFYDYKVITDYWEAWEKKIPRMYYDLSVDLKKGMDQYLFNHTELAKMPSEVKEGMMAPEQVHIYNTFNDFGALFVSSVETQDDEILSILERFGNVFNQSYTRFLDIQKAEAQAREAQIEAALERVRSRSMAMHKSDELLDVVNMVFERLRELNLPIDAAAIFVFEQGGYGYWFATVDSKYPTGMHLPTRGNQVVDDISNARESHVDFFNKLYSFEDKNQFFHNIFENTDFRNIPDERKKFLLECELLSLSVALEKNSGIQLNSYTGKVLSSKEVDVLKRFSRVFEQAYTRFLDLQKAEAQAREAEIQLALERIRARSMAMQSTEELREVVQVMYDQVGKLGIAKWGCMLMIFDEEKQIIQGWFSEIVNAQYPRPFDFDNKDHPIIQKWWDFWESNEELLSIHLRDEEKYDFGKYLFTKTGMKYMPDEVKEVIMNEPQVYFEYTNMDCGIVEFIDVEPFSDESIPVLKRITNVFEQTYTRFRDLQKAEAQAREAHIEAALERVRSRSMAMRHSTELNIILAKVFDELRSLELEFERCVIWIYHPENKSVHWWAANPEAESGTDSYLITNQDHPVYLEYWKAWEQRRTKYLYILEGENMVSWCDVLFNEMELGRLPQEVQNAMRQPERVYLYNTFNDFGVLFLACLEPMSDDKFLILERFGKVFDQSYTRFKDIQQAEAREKEAIRQASLDRVRAEIASMRTTTDLERITPLIWKELITLNISFVRCGVFIMDESLQLMHTFLSTPDGKAIAAFHLPYDSPGRTREILAHWFNKQVYIEHWDETAFSELGDLLVKQGALPSKDVYLKTVPQGGIYLHCLPFMQGMLYVGNTVKLNEDDIQLIQSVADAFATAYARYEDFNKLEAAKQQVDKTLIDLRQTQQQLVQSEKMASLGELTAGIAHEIQNPLNFVNNFSEVSTELVKEMVDEVDKGNTEEVKAIANDVVQNLEKINHHGKRAADIVKGMLQHSRTSSGQKELTDINALCDEYLRLSYHGLRAKDKTFNAKFETDFDTSIPKLNVVSQDIGRVVLNLINNAFYAVNERQKLLASSNELLANFEPTVSVSTKKEGNKVLISVKDNGNGIPDSIKEKIFQPFFTTKPTGQGTGLGLSLSYDIVKAHGGKLMVETKQEEGSKFIIQLPLA